MLRKEQEQRVIFAERVLIKEHWVRLFANLPFSIFIIVLLIFHLLLCHNFFIVQIDVEQDLSRVFFQ